MTYHAPLYAPCIVQKDYLGRILFAQPLRTVDAPGCDRWNMVRRNFYRAPAEHGRGA